MEPDDGQDARTRRGGLHRRPHPSWSYLRWGTGMRSASASTWPPTTRLLQMEPTFPGGSSDWRATDAFRRSGQHWGSDRKPMGLGTEGPGTTDAGTQRSPGNAAGSSAGTIPVCCTFPASSTVAEPARCSSQAAGAAIEPACYTVPAGQAAT